MKPDQTMDLFFNHANFFKSYFVYFVYSIIISSKINTNEIT